MSAGPRALVTGAASGLGRACVERLRDRGYRVAGLDLVAVADDGPEVALVCDVASVDDVAAAVARARDVLGGLDAAVHCAGVYPSEIVPLHALSPREWERTIAVNLTGAYAVARAVLPALVVARGSLVMVASAAATHPQAGAAPYAAAKAGVVALARAAAVDYGHLGVRVNTISPGWMDTPMAAPALGHPATRARIEAAIPAGRVATPEEVAGAVAWLVSEESAYLTGQDIVVDGGLAATAYVGEGDVARAWRGASAPAAFDEG